MFVRCLSVLVVVVAAALTGAAVAQDGSNKDPDCGFVCKASDLKGKAVWDFHGKQTGEVEGLLIDPRTGRIRHMMIKASTRDGESCAVAIDKCHVKCQSGKGGEKQIAVSVKESDLATAPPTDAVHSANAREAGKIVGMNVENVNGDGLGEIETLYVDPGKGCVCYAAIGMGGFLGIGETLHVVPYGALYVRPGQSKAVVTLSREALKRAPAYPRDGMPSMDHRKWHVDVHEAYSVPAYWNGDHRRLRATELAGTPVKAWGKESTGEVMGLFVGRNTPQAFLAVTCKMFPGQISAVPLEGFYAVRDGDDRSFGIPADAMARAMRVPEEHWEKQLVARGSDGGAIEKAGGLRPVDEILGRSVVNAAKESLGEIEELLLDPSSGRIEYAVIGVGGFLGIGEALHIVPWTSLNVADDTVYGIGLTGSSLRKAPTFDPKAWNRVDAAWLDRTDDRYRATPAKP